MSELTTPRLTLRRPTAADTDLIHAVTGDPLACVHNPSDLLRDRAEAADLFARWDSHWERFGFGYWVVRHRGTGAGFCGLKVMALRERTVLNLFYRLAPATWGRGLATEAATAVVRWAAAHHPEHPVVARIRPENVASQRVAVRAGLVRAEHLDDEGYDGLDWVYVSGSPEGGLA
jgi:RimJ/RimL family protein N-acetyltransferase